jgi:hypothetical protein
MDSSSFLGTPCRCNRAIEATVKGILEDKLIQRVRLNLPNEPF